MLNEHAFAILRGLAVIGVGGLAGGFDVRQRRVPNALSAVGLIVGMTLAALQGWMSLGGAAVGAAMFGGPMVVFWLCGWCGAGDAKIGFALGALLGFPLAATGLLLGTVSAGAFCALIIVYSLARSAPEVWRSVRGDGLLGAWVRVRVNPVWGYGQPYALFLGVGSVAALLLTALAGWGG